MIHAFPYHDHFNGSTSNYKRKGGRRRFRERIRRIRGRRRRCREKKNSLFNIPNYMASTSLYRALVTIKIKNSNKIGNVNKIDNYS